MSERGDIIDQAANLTDQLNQAYIQHARRYRPPLKPTGECLYCNEPLVDDKRFCGVECRDDWQKIDNANKRQGL